MIESHSDNNDDNIFIVKVIGTSSKTINIPDEVCKFCEIEHGDIIKLKLIAKKRLTKQK
jgi:hypothetical protein